MRHGDLRDPLGYLAGPARRYLRLGPILEGDQELPFQALRRGGDQRNVAQPLQGRPAPQLQRARQGLCDLRRVAALADLAGLAGLVDLPRE